MKLFPVEVLGGLSYLIGVSAAFNKVKFIPSEGINKINFNSFIQSHSTFAIGGSWMFTTKNFGEEYINDISNKCLNLKKF